MIGLYRKEKTRLGWADAVREELQRTVLILEPVTVGFMIA